MAIRPAFQFYPADWRNNAKLRRCSHAARGAWVDVLCMLHDSDEYGVLRWPLADIAQASGAPMKLLQELAAKGVLKGADSNAEAFVFTPRHGGKDGDPVTLVPTSREPCWYCSRFVRDEYVRQRRGANTRFDTDNQPPKPAPKATPKIGIGGRQGDGASSSSSSSITKEQEQERAPRAPTPAELFPDVDPDHLRDWLAARKAKRLPLTETAAKGFRNAATKAGMTAAEAVKFCAEKGWAGLHADLHNAGSPRGSPPAKPASATRTAAETLLKGTSHAQHRLDQRHDAGRIGQVVELAPKRLPAG